MATVALSGIITPTNVVTATSTTTLTNKTLTGAVMNGTLGATTPSTVVATTVKASTTMGVGGATPSASGSGISFPATQSASTDANTLDDYEEGTWTPSLGGNTTYNSQQPAIYTKVGRMVTVSFEVHVNVLGTGSTTNISGLPFTSSSTGARGSIGFFTSLATNVIAITCAVQDNDNKVVFFSMTTSGSGSTNSPAIFGNSARIQGSLTYSV